MNKLLIDYLSANAKNYNVLIAEDDEIALNNIYDILSKFFNKVYKATNGEEALEIFKNNKIDLVITDINMPKKNGLELIDDIRKISEDINIIIISAYSEDEYFQKAIEENVDGYLLKPINFSQFFNLLVKSVKNLKIKEEKERYFNLLKQYEEIVNKSAIFIKIDNSKKIIYVNEEIINLTGYKKEEILNKDYKYFIEIDDDVFNQLYETVIEKRSIYKGIFRLKTKKRTTKYIKFFIKPLIENDSIKEFVVVGYDISAIMNPKKLLLDEIEKAKNPYLALFKIENFSDVISFFGEKISEEFEQQVFNYIKDICKTQKLYLLENAEIAVFEDGENINFSDFMYKIKKVISLLNEKEVILNDMSYDIFLIVSVAEGKNCFEDCKIGLEKLKNNALSFINSTNYLVMEKEKAEENLKMLRIIKKAINDKKVFCMYQPIINNETLEIEKYEALIRIQDNEKILTPYQFLEVAKKTSFYTKLTKIVFDKSIEFIKNLNEKISVNISSIDIERVNIRKNIINLLENNPEISKNLTIELLESEKIEKDEEIQEFIKYIKNKGVQIAIDDFGSGYSNFIRLLNYRPDFIKIDGSIIKEIDKSKFAYNVAKIVVKFAKQNNIKVIAEFVENESIFKKVKELGIEYSQGYYFSKPKIII